MIPAVDAIPSLGLIPSPDIPGIPKEGDDYSKLLAYSLYFYEAQRSGFLPENNRVSWRHNSALDDGKDRGVNLTGGYYDAGYKLSNQTEYLREMVKWGTDWLITAHPKPSQLFVQVGSSQIDNGYWGPDTNVPYPRPAYDINSTLHGTDVAAEAAAAFASSAILFRDFFNDTVYASTLISHAINVYTFAENKTLQLSSRAIPGTYGYSTSTYTDKLVYGAIWLYKATNQTQYLDKAINYYNQFQLKDSLRIMSWDDQTGACNILLAQIYFRESSINYTNYTTWSGETERYLDRIMTNKSNCSFTNGGLLWCKGDSESASIPISLYGTFGFFMYASYASTIEKANSYKKFASSQIDYLLGANPMKMLYVVAVHPNSPKNPHHAGAHGGTNVVNLNDPPETMYPLYGAVVGGPDINDSYRDLRSDIVQSEVALDYNSAFQGIMAYYVINTYVPPSNPEEPTNQTNSNPLIPNSSSSHQQKIIIITTSLSAFLLLVISAIIVYSFKRHKFFVGNNRKISENLEENNNKNIKQVDDSEKESQDTESETIENSEQENTSSSDTAVDVA
ncbi:12744_t:CDS:2 [Gigaspora margarita]|uniref:cellulase n=1 Tax=Gigaspora margarita TaxID=4874 RepID=A0ABN7UZZ8_GIGMA|nr:12744_t:CDS:2 [Gigaspora margarita]